MKKTDQSVGSLLLTACEELRALKVKLTILVFESPERIESREVYHAKAGRLPFMGTGIRPNWAVRDCLVSLAVFRKSTSLTECKKALVEPMSVGELAEFWARAGYASVSYADPSLKRIIVNTDVAPGECWPKDAIERSFLVQQLSLKGELRTRPDTASSQMKLHDSDIIGLTDIAKPQSTRANAKTRTNAG